MNKPQIMKTKFLLSVVAFCCSIACQRSDAQALNKPASVPIVWSSSGSPQPSPALLLSTPKSIQKRVHRKPAYFQNHAPMPKSDRDVPANDDPCNVTADELTIGGTLTWTGTTEDSDGEVWQAFTLSSCANVSFNFCGTSPGYSSDDLYLLDGECDAFINYYGAAYDLSDCGDGNPVSTFYTLQAGTYFLPIYQVSPEILTYSISVTAAQCAPEPVNDDACTVVPAQLAIGGTLQWSGTTAGAIDQSVAEAFTLSTCANITLDWCGSAPAYYSFFVTSFTGECDSLVFYKNASQVAPDCGHGNPVSTIYALAPGTYYILVFDVTAGAGSTYNVSVSASECDPVPANDLICNAISQSLSIGDSISFDGTLAGALDTEESGQVSVWEAFTLTECADVIFNWCGSQSSGQWANFTLLSGDCTDPDSLSTLSVVSGPENCDDGSRTRIAYILNPGLYYIQVLDPDGSYPDYQFTASANTCSPLPTNDNCSTVSAQILTTAAPLTFTGSTIGASSAGDFGPGWINQQAPTLWHAFTINSCSHVTVRYCNTTPAFGSVWSFISSNCPVDSVFIPGSVDFQQCEGNATIIYYDLPAGTYNLPVMQKGINATGPYSITVSAENCGLYCIGYALNTVPFYEKISNVNFAGIDNSSESGLGYEDFTAISATVLKGESYPLTVTLSNGYPFDHVYAWIDFNQDNSFGDDEIVFNSDTSSGPYSGDILIPANAGTGITRMRFRMDDVAEGHGSNNDACGYATYGQVEDYTLFIDTETGINLINSDSWSLYPNPGNGNFTLRNGGENASVLIEIIDVGGRIIHSEKCMISANGIHTVSPSSIATGIYTVRISTDNLQASRRIVVW